MRYFPAKVNFIPRSRRHWGANLRALLTILVIASTILFIVKMIWPDWSFLASVRRSVLAFIPFSLLILRNAVLKGSRRHGQWAAVGFAALLYMLMWEWTIKTFPTIELRQPPLLIFIVILTLLIGLSLWLHPSDIRFLRFAENWKMNRSNLEHDDDRDDEIEREKQRRVKKFQEDHPNLSAIPVLRSVVQSGYGKGWMSFVAFLAIVAIFVSIRLPYFDDSFFIRFHPGKYVSYVPTAQEMYEAGNPFVFRNPAYAGVFGSVEEQENGSFWRMPILEWTMAPFFSLGNRFSPEEIVRTYLTLLGILLLINLYVLARKIFSPVAALATTFLFSLTPLFNLLTWTTTLDLPALILLLVSLNLFLSKRNDLAFLTLGFVFLSKLSFIVIGLPLFVLFVFFLEKEKIVGWIKLALFSFLPLALFNALLRLTPSHPDLLGKNVLLAFLFVAAVTTGYYFIKGPCTRFFRHVQRKPTLWRGVLGSVGLVLTVFLALVLRKPFFALGQEFLTDSSLVFNIDFYNVLLERIRFMSIPSATLLFIVAVIVCWMLPGRKLKILAAFFLTSLVFLVVASKSIRFGWYYNHFFVLTVFLFIGGLFYQLEKQLSLSKRWNLLAIAVVVALSAFQLNPKPAYVLQSRLTREQIQQIVQLIESRTNSSDKILTYASEYRTFYLYTGMPFIQLGSLTNPDELQQMRKDIREIGFFETMNKYHIRLMIDTKDKDRLISLAYLFTEDTDQTSYERTRLILANLDEEVEYYDAPIRKIYENINLQQYFTEVGSVQGITVYEIVGSGEEI